MNITLVILLPQIRIITNKFLNFSLLHFYLLLQHVIHFLTLLNCSLLVLYFSVLRRHLLHKLLYVAIQTINLFLHLVFHILLLFDFSFVLNWMISDIFFILRNACITVQLRVLWAVLIKFTCKILRGVVTLIGLSVGTLWINAVSDGFVELIPRELELAYLKFVLLKHFILLLDLIFKHLNLIFHLINLKYEIGA